MKRRNLEGMNEEKRERVNVYGLDILELSSFYTMRQPMSEKFPP